MPRLAFEGLELCDGKLSRTVLRGLGASDGPRLPGVFKRFIFVLYSQYLCNFQILDKPQYVDFSIISKNQHYLL
jgi:hypothetical protein